LQDADRDGLMQHLLAKGILCAIYSPNTIAFTEGYTDSRYKEEDSPVTNQLVKKLIATDAYGA
jgi:dTDP-4-amino-4,6-dideoxygalactose transaminase